ncbi:MAG TPA: HDOD domain-containing protein [Terriglobia bacterium]|nr:HDOD domain-containing protein [Terriglobia bacterium]
MGNSDSSERGNSPLNRAIAKMLNPPADLMALTEVLESSPVDLKRLGAVAGHHSDLTSQLLRLCNSPIFSLAEPGTNLEHATIVLGAEVLRTASLAWGIVETIVRSLPLAVVQAFWQHGLTVALLSERIAERMHYPVMEAHLAGLLHDVGRVPFLIAENETGNAEAFLRLPESPHAEAQKFGIDHGELGRRIGTAWRFSDPFVDVFSRHHQPRVQAGDSELVRIVSEVEGFCANCSPANEAFSAPQGWRSGFQQSLRLMEVLELGLLQDARNLKSAVSEAACRVDLPAPPVASLTQPDHTSNRPLPSKV